MCVCAAVKKIPFLIQEQGWGEFDMEIVFHGVDKGGDHHVRHDLNFQKPKYDAIHTVVRIFLSRPFRPKQVALTRRNKDVHKPPAKSAEAASCLRPRPWCPRGCCRWRS